MRSPTRAPSPTDSWSARHAERQFDATRAGAPIRVSNSWSTRDASVGAASVVAPTNTSTVSDDFIRSTFTLPVSDIEARDSSLQRGVDKRWRPISTCVDQENETPDRCGEKNPRAMKKRPLELSTCWSQSRTDDQKTSHQRRAKDSRGPLRRISLHRIECPGRTREDRKAGGQSGDSR